MATWETTSLGTGWINGSLITTADGPIVKITDDDDTDTVFKAGDDLTATTNDNSEVSVVFKGTLTVNGVAYPVVSNQTGTRWFALGLPRNTEGIPKNISESDLNTGDFTVCFFPGTLIATPSGERKVEELVPGDLVLSGDSGAIPATWLGRRLARAVTVKWIGRQTVSTRFGPAERLQPVRLAAGSLREEGGKPLLPHSELTVTADHAMLVDGVLCEAGSLVNQTTITRVPLSEFGDSYTVYHVETEAHEIILANGAPAETFVDNVSRRAFDNFAEFERLQGDSPEMKELPYPRASNARHLPARIKSNLGLDHGARRSRRSAS